MVNSEQVLLALVVIVIVVEGYSFIMKVKRRYRLWKNAREIEKIINERARKINKEVSG
jgi:hypothetical protein